MIEAAKKVLPFRSRDQRRLVRRTAIIDAAERIFATKPFSKVSMRDIAREAGISPALIYRHFPNQQHLFVEAFLRGSQRLVNQLREKVTKDGKASLEETADVFITFLARHQQYFKMMTHFMLEGTMHDALLDKIETAERSLLDQFDSVFQALGAKKNTRMISHCFFAALNGILITFRRHPGRSQHESKKHMDRIGRVITQLFINAIKHEEAGVFS